MVRPHTHRQEAAHALCYPHNVHSFSLTALGAFIYCTLEQLGAKIRALSSSCPWRRSIPLWDLGFFPPSLGLKLMLADAA